MQLTSSEAELSCAFTDLLLMAISILLAISLTRNRSSQIARYYWIWGLCLLAASAFLGACVHGFEVSAFTYATLWTILYLIMGLCVGCFVIASSYDWFGLEGVNRIRYPIFICAGLFWALAVNWHDGFILFMLYQAVALIFVLLVYGRALFSSLPGSLFIVLSVLVLLLAAWIQNQYDLYVDMFWLFDHNGLFHLIQIIGILVLGFGLIRRFPRQSDPSVKTTLTTIPPGEDDQG